MKQTPSIQDKPTPTHDEALQVAARALRELSQFAFARRHWLSFRIAAQFLDRASSSSCASVADRAVGDEGARGAGGRAGAPLGNHGEMNSVVSK